MNIEVNSERSYLGKDIKAWCMSDTEDANALEIKRKYYADDIEFKPSDKVYYFVDYVSIAESYSWIKKHLQGIYHGISDSEQIAVSEQCKK